jgi:organic radical activating enzyme
MLVSEVFGPTVQGEGPSAGRRAAFVRLGLCNLNCQWCDTPYTWDWEHYDRRAELERMRPSDIVARVDEMGVELVVVTGGEPFVQRAALEALLVMLRAEHRVEVETNGTIAPGTCGPLARFNVSPKLAHAHVTRAPAIVPDVLDAFAHCDGTAFKFVCQRESDLLEVDGVMGSVPAIVPSMVWVMPEGRTPDELRVHSSAVVDGAIARGFNVTGRLHIELWGDERGR